MAMDQDLARLYGTPGVQEGDTQKVAEVQLFCKLAADEGIDVRTLTDEQVDTLWNHVFPKQAEFPPPKEEEKKEAPKDEKKEEEKKDEEKKEAAAREHQLKLARLNDEAHAEHCGRKMAHAYVAELREIHAAQEKQASAAAPAATPAAPAAPAAPAGETKEAAMPPALAKALGKVRGAAGKAGEAAGKHKGAIGAGAGGAAAGFAAGRIGKKKESSAIDILALEEAVKIAAAGGFDPEECAELVMAANTLGGPEAVKTASTAEAQIQVRALEYLEAVGYPVTWEQPQAQA